MRDSQTDKNPLLARVRRIAGQVAAIERALLAEAACADILHQVAGVRGAVQGLMAELIEDHLLGHVARPDLSDAERAACAQALVAVIRRYAK